MALVPIHKFCHPAAMSTRYLCCGLFVCVVWGTVLAEPTSGSGEGDTATGVSEEAYSDLMANEVLDLQDLAEGAEIQRRVFNRITPSGFSWLQPMFPSVAPFDAKYFDEAFLDSLLGEETNSVAVYPLSLVLDPKTRETLIYNAEGELITSVPPDGVSRAWPADTDPSRVTLTLDLIPAEDAEQFLYAEDRIAGTLPTSASKSAKSLRTGGFVMMSLSSGQFGISDIQRLTNGNFRVSVTNGTNATMAEVFSYTVWHSSLVNTGEWVNDEGVTNISTNTLWNPTSPPFNGLESDWDFGTTNLVLTNGVGTWEDSNISSNARVRFYGAAEREDADHDGLTDGAELFVHHTDPGNPDTDGDGWSDGAEIEAETDPLDRFNATHLACGVVLNEVLYDATGTDAGNEWIEIYSAGRYPVDLGGFVIQVGDTAFTNAYTIPSNTWIDPGRFLLMGGSLVTNRDLEVNFTMPNRFTNDATAAVRLAAEVGANTHVADCLMYGGNEVNFNPNELDTTGWISTNARSAGAGKSLVRLYVGHDTDQVLDWQWTSMPTTNSACETPDSDGDGLTDQVELTGSSNVFYEATNPLNVDSDGDGLTDYQECITYETNPNTWATDGDLFPWPPTNNAVSNWWGSDSYELANGWNPRIYDENTNGIPDSWEMAFPGTNLYADADGDHISNFDELEQNSNPFDPNSTSAQPYVLRFESSKSGWTNNGLIDVGLKGWVKVYFEGIKTNLGACVWVVEGQTQEEFQVTWIGASNSSATWFNENREVTTGASLAPGPCPYLLIQDSGMHPEYTNTLGGEYIIEILKLEIMTPATNENHVYLSQTNYNETGPISFAARVMPAEFSYSGSIDWRIIIEYESDGSGGPLTNVVSTSSGNAQSFNINYISKGGRLAISASVVINGATCAATITNFITGTGIPNATITQRLNALYSPPAGGTTGLLTGIAMKESTYRQFFNSFEKYGVTSRWPVENMSTSPPQGSYIGMMQVPVAMDTAWDWLVNTQTGASIFSDKLSNASGEVANHQAANPGLRALTGSELENYALGLFGGFSTRYYTPILNGGQWDWQTTTRQDLLDYADFIRNNIQ